METRNIRDSLGNVIGQLELPDGTSEAVWTQTLALYSATISQSVASRIATTIASATSTVTTSSSSESVISGMTITPLAGTYVAFFSGSIYTGGASAIGEFGIYVNDVLLAETRRDISCNLQLLGGLVTISLNSIGVGTYTGTQMELSGIQRVDVKFRSTNGGTIGFKERVLTLIQVK